MSKLKGKQQPQQAQVKSPQAKTALKTPKNSQAPQQIQLQNPRNLKSYRENPNEEHNNNKQ